MNQYQRVGTFIVRIVASVAILVGVIGIGYAAVVKAGLVSQAASDRASMALSAVWLGCGLILVFLSGRLGRWLGRGLE
jgi:ABC-type enterochelin transport system permease subunit